MRRFFGREHLMRTLGELWGKSVPSFVTCRGRRRVGKSTLIERFAEVSGARLIKIEGAKPTETTTDEDERRAFARQLAAQTDAEDTCPSNWLNAFIRLAKEIDGDTRTIVLLDEVSWMGCFDDTFSAMLKIAWDNYLKKRDHLVFVVCGSVSTWIRDNIIDNKAFYGRRSLDIVVPELPLAECVKFWGDKASHLAEREILDVLAVTGGIPRYLEELNPSLVALVRGEPEAHVFRAERAASRRLRRHVHGRDHEAAAPCVEGAEVACGRGEERDGDCRYAGCRKGR